MTRPSFLLHHYDQSPYAEKIRLMFGLAGSEWGSILSPAIPPRPNVDPLSGGYRRIPIAQIGADVFCDTALIADEVAALTGIEALGSTAPDDRAMALANTAEGEVFFSAITGIPTYKLLPRLIIGLGPLGMMKFAKDRSGMMKGGSARPPQGKEAAAVFDRFLITLNEALGGTAFLAGDAPDYADFAAYHPLWLRLNVGGGSFSKVPEVTRWMAAMAALGQGKRHELAAEEGFAAARETEPRALPESSEDHALLGQSVSVAPADYGKVPVAGTLAAVTADRVIVARSTTDYGAIHVHFPRSGYEVAKG